LDTKIPTGKLNTHSTIYLVPCVLEEKATHTIPAYIIDAVKNCKVIFAENERTARRFLKSIWPAVVIDEYEWFTIHKAEQEQVANFKQKLKEAKNIAIISEAGCPGVADPGQVLVDIAHQEGAVVKPLVGPSSILLALMASGLNGQQFEFVGYLPIDIAEKTKAIKQLETASAAGNSTKIFIETPYRNNQLIETIVKTCGNNTRLCVAVDITADTETIETKTIAQWKIKKPDIHKRPAIFLLHAG
jgi:16S rRNA (cytidine1402-2'-O)-methyltransferase